MTGVWTTSAITAESPITKVVARTTSASSWRVNEVEPRREMNQFQYLPISLLLTTDHNTSPSRANLCYLSRNPRVSLNLVLSHFSTRHQGRKIVPFLDDLQFILKHQPCQQPLISPRKSQLFHSV